MRGFMALGCILMSLAAARAETVEELLTSATAAIKDNQLKKAMAFLDRAVAEDPKDARPWFMRGSLREAMDNLPLGLADLSKAIALDGKLAQAYQERGSVYFKLGKFADSIKDYDKFLELRPDRKPWHWQRGISYYYAGRYEDGQKQFEGYQSVDANDVENVVWRYLCMARKHGVAKARADLLKVGKDERIPMKQVYEMFAGRARPQDVLDAAMAGKASAGQRNERLFYAHLYIALFYDAEQDRRQTLQHLEKAVDEHRIGHYMWYVARVHRDLLRKQSANR
jgi:lipoprotein NlpI